ncbi:hypothetical protein CN198_33875 [Sinorhizobium meliloti]|nr:hypothetical protein CN198_33875 [Sinorhizobium meliloti]
MRVVPYSSPVNVALGLDSPEREHPRNKPCTALGKDGSLQPLGTLARTRFKARFSPKRAVHCLAPGRQVCA